MTEKKVQTTIRLSEDDYNDLKVISKSENKSINGILVILIDSFLDDYFLGNSAVIDAKNLLKSTDINCNVSRVD